MFAGKESKVIPTGTGGFASAVDFDSYWQGAALEQAVNLGIALEDMATGIRVYRAAVEAGIGTRLPL